MLALVIVLVVSNLVTVGALVYLRARRAATAPEPMDEAVRAALDELARRGPTTTRSRQFISVEILNPIELAATRGRVLGLAGTFAPGFTRRLVYDQTVKTLRQQLAEHRVVADVHVHSLRPVADGAERADTADARTLVIDAAEYVDDVDVPLDPPRDQPPV